MKKIASSIAVAALVLASPSLIFAREAKPVEKKEGKKDKKAEKKEDKQEDKKEAAGGGW